MSTTTDPRTAIAQLDQTALNELLNHGKGPFVSIYMPTERRGADTRKNAIRYKDLLKQAEAELKAGDAGAAEAMLGELHAISDDNDFWQHQLDGLAIFRGPELFRIYRLGRPVPEKAAVADSFHVKPLLRILQSATRYQLLAVTQKHVALYEGDLDTLDEVPLHGDVPKNIIDALGGQVDGELNVNSYGGMSYSGMFHGHHDSKDAREKDRERYLRAVDRAVYDHHRRSSQMPLYFAGDVDYHDTFNRVTHDPRATKKGIRINPDAAEVGPDRLRQEMESVLKPALDAEVHELSEQFGNAKAKGQGSSDVREVAEAALQGRVLTLLVNADMSVGGVIDPETGKAIMHDEGDPHADDLLDDLCELTMKTGGRVRVLPGDQHPTDSGVAAIYRY